MQKAVLCGASEYFSKALQPSFREGQENVLHLPGCNKDVFELFLYWLCHRTLPNLYEIVEEVDLCSSEQKQFYNKQTERLIVLWAFSDASLMPKLQNETMRRLQKLLSHNTVGVEAVWLAFELTATGSVLRDVVVKETSLDIADNAYNKEELSMLGAIQGFLHGFVKDFVNLPNEERDTMQRPSKSEEALTEYMVPEP